MATVATPSIFIEKRRPGKTDKKCAISIRICSGGIKKYFSTPHRMTVEDFAKMHGEKPRAELKKVLRDLTDRENRAAEIIDKLPVFTFPAFENEFVQDKKVTESVFQAFDNYIEMLNKESRVGSAVAYQTAKNSLIAFCKAKSIKDRVTFPHIDVSFLNRYEQWMYDQNNSAATIGIYLRALRCLFNQAIEDNDTLKQFYPFGKRRFQIPTGRNFKRSLSLEDIGKIYNYRAPSATTERMKNFWLMIFLCNGLNPKDLCRLKYKNIQGELILFNRSKTERTKRIVQEIRVPLNSDVKEIIEKYGNKSISPESYIFPILEPGVDAARERVLVKQFTRNVNDHMLKVTTALEIPHTTTITGRHSWATILRRAGVSTEFIQEGLGHTNKKTTENYLGSFETKALIEANKALTAFKTA
jgi:integrase